MSLLTYDDARPRAKAIRDEVSEGHMPPWHAEAPHGTFLNERELTDDEKKTLVALGERRRAEGRSEGHAAGAGRTPTAGRSASRTSSSRCRSRTRFRPRVSSSTEYFYIPTNFTEPKWIQAIEVRPGNREVVHHALAFYSAKPDIQRTPVLQPNRDQMDAAAADRDRRRGPERDDEIPRPPARHLRARHEPAGAAGPAPRSGSSPVASSSCRCTTRPTAKRRPTGRRLGCMFAKDPSPREVRVTHFFNGTSEPSGRRT